MNEEIVSMCGQCLNCIIVENLKEKIEKLQKENEQLKKFVEATKEYMKASITRYRPTQRESENQWRLFNELEQALSQLDK